MTRFIRAVAIVGFSALLAGCAGAPAAPTAAPSKPTTPPAPTIAPTVAPTVAATVAPTAAPKPTIAPTVAPAPSGGGGSSVDLASVCPSPIVMQTNWFPEPEHSALYQMVASDGDLDVKKGTYTAKLLADPRVSMQIRAGGPFIGFQTTSSLMYQDKSIFAGYVSTDESVKLSKTTPTVAVVSPLVKDPQILMWDPTQFQFKTFADIGKSNAKVLYFEGGAYMDYLVGAGYIREEQLDSSYDGTPARFVAEKGLVQQEYVTQAIPWYEREIAQWGKPISWMLVADSGYDIYPSAIAVRSDALAASSACLTKLVPLIQQAQIDYVKNPKRVNELLVKNVAEMKGSFTLPAERAAFVAEALVKYNLVANGGDHTLGSLEPSRIQHAIDVLKPIYSKRNVTSMNPDVKPDDIATNKFVDPKIAL
jgi:hypothetical protein